MDAYDPAHHPDDPSGVDSWIDTAMMSGLERIDLHSGSLRMRRHGLPDDRPGHRDRQGDPRRRPVHRPLQRQRRHHRGGRRVGLIRAGGQRHLHRRVRARVDRRQRRRRHFVFDHSGFGSVTITDFARGAIISTCAASARNSASPDRRPRSTIQISTSTRPETRSCCDSTTSTWGVRLPVRLRRGAASARSIRSRRTPAGARPVLPVEEGQVRPGDAGEDELAMRSPGSIRTGSPARFQPRSSAAPRSRRRSPPCRCRGSARRGGPGRSGGSTRPHHRGRGSARRSPPGSGAAGRRGRG